MRARDLAEISYCLVCLRSLGYRTAREEGLAPQEYELLLAIKAMPRKTRRGIGELAAWLQMQRHGVVELATGLERRRLVRRYHDQDDGRRARLVLTRRGRQLLQEAVALERARVRSCGTAAISTLQRFVAQLPRNGNGHTNGKRPLP
jgi:DNA-binding MarR family transcriptional regulator